MGSLTVQNLATSAMGFIFVSALIHLLPQEQYGIYSAVLLTTGIVSTIAVFGLNTAVARFIAFLGEKDENKAWVAARSILLLSIVLSIAATVVFFVISPYLSLYFTKSESWTWVFLLGGVYVLLSSIITITQGIIQGLKKYTALAKIIFVSRLVMTVFAIGVLEIDHSVFWAIISWLVYCVMILGLTLSLSANRLFRAKGAFNYSEVIRYTAPLGVAAIITILSTSADQIVVGGYLNPASLAVYNAAVTLSSALSQILVTPLATALLPEAASTSLQRNVANGFRLALRFVMIGLLPCSLLMASLAPQLLSLFTGESSYLAGTGSLELITIFYIFSAIQSVSLILLQAVGKTTRVLFVGAIAATVDILFAVSLVPRFGIIGAAGSKVAVFLLGATVAVYFLGNYTKNLDRLRFYLKGVICATIPFVIIQYLSYYVSSRILTLVPYTAIYLVLFLICSKATRLLNDEDRTFLSHVLPQTIQRFVKYV